MNKVIQSQINCRHSGNTVGSKQSEKRVIAATADFIIKTNVLLSTFRNVNSKVKLEIFKAISMSLHESPLWDLSSLYIDRFYVSRRKAIRRIFNLPYQTHCKLLHLITQVLPIDMQLHIRTVKFLKSISMSGNDIVKMYTKLCLNGSGIALANSINFISYKYNVYKLRLCSPMINARATFTSKCKESERDKRTASFIRDVLESDTSFFQRHIRDTSETHQKHVRNTSETHQKRIRNTTHQTHIRNIIYQRHI